MAEAELKSRELGGGIMGFLLRGGVKTRGCQLAEFIENCLFGAVVADFHAEAVCFEEGVEEGKVTDVGKGGGCWSKGRVSVV